jgi:hypothetical protein
MGYTAGLIVASHGVPLWQEAFHCKRLATE